jgi:two-component system sensor histidine kinase PilS (NtrC family)
LSGSSPERLDVARVLRVFAWSRLIVAVLIALTAPFIPADLLPRTNAGLLLAAFLTAVASSAAVLRLAATVGPQRTAWWVCMLDVVLVTGVVATTGGAKSILTFLYVLLVMAAGVLLSRVGGLMIAALSSGLYTALVFARTVVPVTHFWEPIGEGIALEILTIFVNAGTMLVVGIAAGGLAARILAAQRELETRGRDLKDLTVFKDLIFQSVGTGLIALDRDQRITAFNRAAEAISGVPAVRAVGRQWAELFGAPAPAVPALDARASTRDETELSRPDGTRVPVRVTTSPLLSSDGLRIGVIATCDDLSPIREMEARMRQADRLAALGRLAANIAHEIRNPLASLTGAIEALASGGSRDERERLTQIVLRESERLNDMIKAFLDYARPTPLATAVIDVAEVLEEVLLLLTHRELPPGLKIVRDFPPALLWDVDQHRLRQALWNLCLNAVEAMPAGGELTVSAAADERALRISITDTGDGIARNDLAHIFEPFFSTKPAGSGLGLALVHRIARDHGGEVDVRSTPGTGTTFVLALPASNPILAEALRA